MRRTLTVLFLCELAAGGALRAQELDGFEIPQELKGRLNQPCPEGQQKNEKGECAPAPPPAPLPATPPPAAGRASRPPVAPALPPEASASPAATSPAVQPAPVAPAADSGPAPSVPAALPVENPREQAAEARLPKGQEVPPEVKEPEKKAAPFVKGELADFVGSTKLVTANNRLGVCFGYRRLDTKHFATISPEADFRIWRLEVGLGVPLSVEIFDGAIDSSTKETIGFANAGSLRSEDWNEPSEYLRFLRYLRLGKKEDRLFIDLSQYASKTIGHGALMRRYNVNVDPDSTRLSFELDAYNDYGGFELVGNDLVQWDVFGVLGFLKPLSFFLDGTLARSLSLGFTYAADRHAPVALVTQTSPSVNRYWIEGTDKPEVASSAFLQGMGVDLELKVLRTEHLDIKPYLDYSWFIPGQPGGSSSLDPHGGGGFTLGVLGRLSFGESIRQGLRAVAEFRSFSATYQPGYFDTFYEIRKFLAHTDYRAASASGGLPPTKFVDTFVNARGQGRRLGYYLELSYSLVDKAAVTLAWEGADYARSHNLLAHLEVYALKWLQFFASFQHRNAGTVGDLLGSSGDRIVFAAARLRLLPFLFVNGRYFHTFELAEDYRDVTGDGLLQHVRLYRLDHSWSTDVELGWEF
jgi:hypothetical protein